jgi:lactoylglutathione lyase
MIKQLAHINFFSNQAPKLLDFYVNQLGLKIKFTLDHEDGAPFGWYVDCGNGTFIEIFDQEGAAKQWHFQAIELIKGSQYRHLCFEVADLEGYRQGLVAKGLAVTQITMGMDHSYQCWIKDPDGNDIELMEYTPDSFQLRA